MKNRIATAVFTAAALTFAAGLCQATETANFVSGNKNNDGKFTPRNVIHPKPASERVPGFWDKEWKRSGLDQTIGKAIGNPFSGTGKYLKQKEEAYRAKHPAAVTASASPDSSIK